MASPPPIRYDSGDDQARDKLSRLMKLRTGTPSGTPPEQVQMEGPDTGQKNQPIEPEGRSLFGGSKLKWILFLIFVLYALIARYYEPLLQKMGSYLAVSDEPRQVDLAVISLGNPLDRTLTAADWYNEKRTKTIFVGRTAPPDGAEEFLARRLPLREERDRILRWLEALQVPSSACLLDDTYLEDVTAESITVKRIATENRHRRIAVITAPLEGRRIASIYRDAFKDTTIDILIIPSSYSSKGEEAWWRSSAGREAVLTEYVRLALTAVSSSR